MFLWTVTTHLRCTFVIKGLILWDTNCGACRAWSLLMVVGIEGICHLAWAYAQRGNIRYLPQRECQLWSITAWLLRWVLGQISVLSLQCSPGGQVSYIMFVPLPVPGSLFEPPQLNYSSDRMGFPVGVPFCGWVRYLLFKKENWSERENSKA